MFRSVILLRLSRMQEKVYIRGQAITSVKKFEYFRTSSLDLEEVYVYVDPRTLFCSSGGSLVVVNGNPCHLAKFHVHATSGSTEKTCLGKCLEMLLNFLCRNWSSVN